MFLFFSFLSHSPSALSLRFFVCFFVTTDDALKPMASGMPPAHDCDFAREAAFLPAADVAVAAPVSAAEEPFVEPMHHATRSMVAYHSDHIEALIQAFVQHYHTASFAWVVLRYHTWVPPFEEVFQDTRNAYQEVGAVTHSHTAVL